MQLYIQRKSNIKSVGVMIFRRLARDTMEDLIVFTLTLKSYFSIMIFRWLTRDVMENLIIFTLTLKSYFSILQSQIRVVRQAYLLSLRGVHLQYLKA